MQPLSKQRISKHASTAMELLLETVFLLGPCEFVIKRSGANEFSWALQGRLRRNAAIVHIWQELCTGGCDKRTCAREVEESLLLEAVAKERLLETLQARGEIACRDLSSVKISDSAVITCSSEWSVNTFTKPYSVYSHTLKSLQYFIVR
jgi:hypothetical protein